MNIIDQHIDELKKLCTKFHVAELYVFGSIAKGDFTDKSDIDFLVRFSGVNPFDYFDNYLKDDYKKLREDVKYYIENDMEEDLEVIMESARAAGDTAIIILNKIIQDIKEKDE